MNEDTGLSSHMWAIVLWHPFNNLSVYAYLTVGGLAMLLYRLWRSGLWR